MVVLLPLAEEPFLREQFGETDERDREEVPRFVGRRTVRELLSAVPALVRVRHPVPRWPRFGKA
jgi:hypothetical protein